MKRKTSFLLTLTALTLVLAGCFLVQTQVKPPHLVAPTNGQQDVDTTVTLKWTDPNTSPDTYKVYFGTKENPPFYETATLTNVTLKNLKYSTTYYWEIAVYNGVTSATSETWSFMVGNPPYPSTPVLNVSAKSTDSVTLSWKTSNASEMILYKGNGTSYLEIGTFTLESGNYTVKGLSPSTTYEFYMVAKNPYGNRKSNVVTVTTDEIESKTSTFSIYVTDKPMSPSQASAVYVSVSNISINMTFNGTSTWKEVMGKSRKCDLMNLIGSATMLAEEVLPSSSAISQIDLKFSGATVVVYGKSYKAKMLKNEVKINVNPFEVAKSTSVYLDFDLSTSMQCMGKGKYEFSPELKVVCGKNRAELKGKLEHEGVGVENAILSLTTENSTVSQTFSKKGGYFNFIAVPAGNYTLEIQASGLSTYSTQISLKKGINDLGIVNLPTFPSGKTSNFSVYLTDDPISPVNASAVYVTISNVSLKSSTSMKWYTVLSTPTTYNVLSLMGTSTSMASTFLPASTVVNQIRMEIISATVIVGTQTFIVEVPHKIFTMTLNPFKTSQEKSLYLDFNLSDSIVYMHHAYVFLPHIRAVCGSQRAMLEGKVLLNSQAVKNALVTLSDSSTVVSKTYTRHNGKFIFAAVKVGKYTLNVSVNDASMYSTEVTLSMGMNSVGDIELNKSTPIGTHVPASPVITSLKVYKNKVNMYWTESSTNVDSFEVFRKNAFSPIYRHVANLSFKTFKYEDIIATPGTYCYEVVALNAYGSATSISKCVDVKFKP